jgi:hypothetical protein
MDLPPAGSDIRCNIEGSKTHTTFWTHKRIRRNWPTYADFPQRSEERFTGK